MNRPLGKRGDTVRETVSCKTPIFRSLVLEAAILDRVLNSQLHLVIPSFPETLPWLGAQNSSVSYRKLRGVWRGSPSDVSKLPGKQPIKKRGIKRFLIKLEGKELGP